MNSKTYRADKVVTLKDAGIKLANGDKDLEAELLDTLKRWPHYSNWEVTLRLKKGHLASEVLLGAVVSFLEGEGFLLGEEWPRLKSNKLDTNQTPQQKPHMVYLVELIKNWDNNQNGQLTAPKAEKHIVEQIKSGDHSIPFELFGNYSLSIRSEKREILAFKNMFGSAKTLAGILPRTKKIKSR